MKDFTSGAGVPRGKLGKPSASSRKKAKPTGIDPGNPHYGIKNTSKKHSSAVTGGSRNTPNGQSRLSSKAKRQVG